MLFPALIEFHHSTHGVSNVNVKWRVIILRSLCLLYYGITRGDEKYFLSIVVHVYLIYYSRISKVIGTLPRPNK